MTNGDKIRSMTDEELAEFINGITGACSDGECSQCAMCNYKFDVCSEASILQKLKEEEEDAGTETD
jgi:predicted metal-binding protein